MAYGSSEGSSERVAAFEDNPKFGRGLGGPRRDGNMLFGRIPKGEDGATRFEVPAIADGTVIPGSFGRIGEDGLAIWERAGEADRGILAGEPGLANREIPETAGLAGRGEVGESERMPVPARRDTCAGCAGVCGTSLPGLLGPATRRRRSSSCVLSFDDNGPTSDQTFSPIKEYTSLRADRADLRTAESLSAIIEPKTGKALLG